MNEYQTGAVRDTGGKGRMDLLPMCALIRISKHMEDAIAPDPKTGVPHYPERNWEKGLPMHSMIDSAFRHLAKYVDGQMERCRTSPPGGPVRYLPWLLVAQTDRRPPLMLKAEKNAFERLGSTALANRDKRLEYNSVVVPILEYINSLPNAKAVNIHGSIFSERGTPDIIGCINGTMVAFECKRDGTEDLRKIQKWRLSEWLTAGAVVGGVSDLEHVKWILWIMGVV